MASHPQAADSASRTSANTAERTLDVAERLVALRGFNGFSYADIADEVGVTKASLHYHFRGKAELGKALIARYSARFAEALESIDRDVTGARAKLDAYVSIYSGVLKGGRMCLCGMLAAEYETLPTTMGEAVVRFLQYNEEWLTDVLTEGQADGSLSAVVTPADASQMILSGLEGAMLIARTYGGLARFQGSAGRLLDALTLA
ncbi:MAG TPA: TetR/AcrR family transcriptional regulator [Solirubrobacteraceae bacterium]|jgi:TetR/AcrR family transcriptional repressor of nem operon|nr:TetR/AcrR family transcriptional regulator [Solirubrobacteraceae bacterium]